MIITKHVLVCGICGVRGPIFKSEVAFGSEMPMPALPDDWHVLDKTLICPRHTVAVKDKEAEQ